MFSQCFGMLQVCRNEISLRQWSGGSAQLRTLEGTLVLLHANYTLFWQQCFFSHSIKQGFPTFLRSTNLSMRGVILLIVHRKSKCYIIIGIGGYRKIYLFKKQSPIRKLERSESRFL